MIDFASIASYALASGRSLVESWLPGGRYEGSEYVPRNPTRPDDNPGSFKINLKTGSWADFATGDKGGDLISLFAYINRIDQGEAAEKLAEYFRLNPAPAERKSGQQTSGDTWTQVFPVPADAPTPPDSFPRKTGSKWVRYPIAFSWGYHDRMGNLLGYVVRYETPEGKETPPLTLWRNESGQLKWKFRAFPPLRPLFNLHKIVHHPGAQIIVLEGEKKASLLQDIIEANNAADKLTATCWQGGAQSIKKADFSPLKNRNVILWPDADEPGTMAMDAVSQIIAKLGAKIRILKIPEDKPRAWDVADATLVDGWKLPEILAFIRQTMGEVIAPDAPGPAGNPPPAPESPPTEPPDTQEWPFRCLGYDAGYHYYLPIGTRQVRAIRGEAHTSSALLDLANLKFWERSFPGPTGPAWKYAANAMLRTNETIGVYDAMRQRGRGAWYDSGRSVLHLGDRLIVDGKAQSIHELRSRFIYEAAPPLEFTEAIPLPNSEAVKLQRIIDMLFWAKPIYAKLCAGWCVIAPVCGALIYRPHIWITASPGSGKTFIIENIIKPCLGEFSLAVSSKTTEAGIRQTLRNDALAVIIDEFEGEDYLSQINIQKILDLARQSFSNSSTRIVKGGQNGHATAYNIRSCFFMSSVGVNLSQHADETRISVLELEEPYDRDNKSKHENFKQLQDDVTNILTEDFCAGLRARAINYVQILQKNSSVFSLVVSQLLGNQRAGDQVGALLAGAHLLVSDKAITFEQAQEWVNKQDWEDQREVTEKSDGMECLNAIFHHVAKTNSNQEKSIIEMLIECRNNIPISGEESDEGMILRRHGIRYVRSENRVYISEYHPGLKRILKNSAWPKCWGRTLARIPGAIRKISMRFYGPPTRAVGIPFEDSWVD